MQRNDRPEALDTGQPAPKSARSRAKLQVASGDEPKNGRTRLQIEATEATQETLARLVRETRLGSSAQVVRVAVQLMDELLRDQRNGASLLIVKDGQQPERLRLVF
ncbi:MAG: hypothetical protein JWM10_3153 [Myxococcaceae bacterium]|nr:hypothetical protein [Myxococcaceae bacterium]